MEMQTVVHRVSTRKLVVFLIPASFCVGGIINDPRYTPSDDHTENGPHALCCMWAIFRVVIRPHNTRVAVAGRPAPETEIAMSFGEGGRMWTHMQHNACGPILGWSSNHPKKD